ncbi:MAG: hypothetical protein WC955_10635 [Elusimicrobiota bacterium]
MRNTWVVGSVHKTDAHKGFITPKTFADVLDSYYYTMYDYHVNIMHRDPQAMKIDRAVYGKRKIVSQKVL